MRHVLVLALLFGCAPAGSQDTGDRGETGDGGDSGDSGAPVQVALETSMGTITVEMAPEAPVTTANFLQYVDDGYYDGEDGKGATIFHRVISGFMIQGGGLTESLQAKTTRSPIVNESDNGLSNARGTIAMARTNDPNSATSQFFINHVDNAFLDIDGQYPPGYAVFGHVVDGMDVVDAIAAVATGTRGSYQNVPNTAIVIGDARRVE